MPAGTFATDHCRRREYRQRGAIATRFAIGCHAVGVFWLIQMQSQHHVCCHQTTVIMHLKHQANSRTAHLQTETSTGYINTWFPLLPELRPVLSTPVLHRCRALMQHSSGHPQQVRRTSSQHHACSMRSQCADSPQRTRTRPRQHDSPARCLQATADSR